MYSANNVIWKLHPDSCLYNLNAGSFHLSSYSLKMGLVKIIFFGFLLCENTLQFGTGTIVFPACSRNGILESFILEFSSKKTGKKKCS